MDGTCLAVGTVAREGSFHSGGGRGQRIWRRLGGLQKLTWGCLKEIVSDGV